MTETYDFEIDGKEFSVTIDDKGNGELLATVSGTQYVVKLPEGSNNTPPTPRRRSSGRGAKNKSGIVSTSIPGKIVTIDVSTGETVKEGQVILILEAMKMQNEVTAPLSGKISEINCSEGDNVEANMALVVIEPESEKGDKTD